MAFRPLILAVKIDFIPLMDEPSFRLELISADCAPFLRLSDAVFSEVRPFATRMFG